MVVDGNHHLFEEAARIFGQPVIDSLSGCAPHRFPHHLVAEKRVARQRDAVTREGGSLKDVVLSGDEGVEEGVAGEVHFIIRKEVVAILVADKNHIAGGVAELQHQRVVAFGAVAQALPFHARQGSAGGLVVKAQIEGVADTHVTVQGEVVVEADGQRGKHVSAERFVGGGGIHAAIFVECIEGGDAHGRRQNSEGAVDVGVAVLP